MTRTYIAFLLGINVGKRQVKMVKLIKTMEDLGFSNVHTLLASGNVIFESDQKDVNTLMAQIEKKLALEFGFEIKVILRTIDQIKNLIHNDPFMGVPQNKDTMRYLTFFRTAPTQKVKTPYVSEDKTFGILTVTDTEAASYKTLVNGRGTVDAMKIYTEKFGKDITTRNWNTILKIVR